MVVLSITPYRGNHQRIFPHTGFLGLTPVVIQGTVRTTLEEDRKCLKASSLSVRVRCYEAELSTIASVKGKRKTHILYERVVQVWAKGEKTEWGTLGDFVSPFRIVLPIDAGGVTTSTFKTFKTWWQVEAVIYHKPSSVLGSRRIVSHQLPLTRYSESALSSTLAAPSWNSSLKHSSTGLQYSVNVSKSVYAPDEEFELSTVFHSDDRSLQVKKIMVSLDRYLVVDSTVASPTGSDEEEVNIPDDETLVESIVHDDDGPPTFTNLNPFAPPPYAITPPSSSSRPPAYFTFRSSAANASPTSIDKTTTVSQVMAMEAADIPCGVESRIVGVFPKTKSLYRYSLGETLRTRLARIHFRLSIKVHVKTKTGNIEIVDLNPLPIAVTAASNEDRRHALANIERLLAIADAELRLFHPSRDVPLTAVPNGKLVPGSPRASRRSSGIPLGLEQEDDLPVVKSQWPPREVSPGPSRPKERRPRKEDITPRHSSSIRRRSEQGDGAEAPVRSKQKRVAFKDDTTLSPSICLRAPSPSNSSTSSLTLPAASPTPSTSASLTLPLHALSF